MTSANKLQTPSSGQNNPSGVTYQNTCQSQRPIPSQDSFLRNQIQRTAAISSDKAVEKTSTKSSEVRNRMDSMDEVGEKRKRMSVDEVNSSSSATPAESAESAIVKNIAGSQTSLNPMLTDDATTSARRKRRRSGSEKSGNETILERSVASSDNTDASGCKSEEEHSIEFCRILQSSHSFLIAANYDDRDSLVHIEVQEKNQLEVENSVKRLEKQFKRDRGYCPNYTIELIGKFEYKQAGSPPGISDDQPKTATSSGATKLPLRPGTHIQSTTLQACCLFSGTLNDNKGVSVAHAFPLDDFHQSHEMETVPVNHQTDVYRATFGKCSKVFNTDDVNDLALIEIDTEKCNPENVVFYPDQHRRRIRIYRGAPVAGNTRVMILNKHGVFKEGYIRREPDISHTFDILGNMHNVVAISSQKEYSRKEPITESGDSGALVMSIPSEDENEIDVYGIVTGLITKTGPPETPQLTVANSIHENLCRLAEMNEVSPNFDFK